MRKRPRDTTPPNVLPLLPIAFIAILQGYVVIGLANALFLLTGIEDIQKGDDLTKGAVALDLIPQVTAFVALSFVLRWLIERWVGRYPPRPGTRELQRGVQRVGQHAQVGTPLRRGGEREDDVGGEA